MIGNSHRRRKISCGKNDTMKQRLNTLLISTTAAAVMIQLLILQKQIQTSFANSYCRINTITSRNAVVDLKKPTFLVTSSLSSPSLISLRGGSLNVDMDSESEDLDSSEEDEDESETEDFSEEEDEEETEDDDEEEEGESTVQKSAATGPPVKIIVRTNLNSPLLIDQTLEFTASRTRDVTSIKQSIFRQMRGKPPVMSQSLIMGSRLLRDDEILSDLINEQIHGGTDEDDDEDEFDEDDEEEDDITMNFILDIPPPIDPKFGTEFKDQLKKLTVTELLDAYVANVASLHGNSMAIFQDDIEEEDDDDKETNTKADTDDDEEDEEEEIRHESFIPKSIQLRKHALMVKQNLMDSFPANIVEFLEKQEELMQNGGDDTDEETDTSSKSLIDMESSMLLKSSMISKAGSGTNGVYTKSTMRGGAKMQVRRALQKNLNIHWPSSIRNSLLFLFFGHFGARDVKARMLMLFGAPMVFIIQIRQIKIWIKQIFYAIGKPPSIFLSLLPAPQQTIMSLDVEKYMRDIYGDVDEDMKTAEEDSDVEDDEEQYDDDYDDDEYD